MDHKKSPKCFSEHKAKFGILASRSVLICLVTLSIALIAQQPKAHALWLFQQQSPNQTLVDQNVQLQNEHTQDQQQESPSSQKSSQQQQGSSIASYGSSLMTIAGIEPSSIASLLNTVGDTGFKYFNIQDQCRNRAACDLGHMLYRKLSFVHNWLIRTSVRTLTDMNNVYTQSWMEGMLGRNCTAVYMSCRQSPLEGLMNLALLQHLAT